MCDIMWFYQTLLCYFLYTDCILVIRHPDDGHGSD